jgi:beta-N-acetylhexosaminidase
VRRFVACAICAVASVLLLAPASPGQTRTLRRDVGQMLMGRIQGVRPSGALLRRVRAGELGGVILFSDNVRSRPQVRRLVRRLQRAAAAGGNPPLLVAVDQEGGLVRRLPWAPPTLSAAAMGRARDPAGVARAQGAGTARELARDGINVDLAPVADVPSVPRSFLGSRAFGRSSSRVARAACAFAGGLTASRRVAATLKHFPGLGAAPANTDFAAVTITAPLERLRSGYRPYRRCAARPRRLVMVASAAYRRLTGDTPAVLSSVTYRRELRGRLRFRGVTISDDLQADALQGRRSVAFRAARAGLDVLLYARTESGSAAAFRRLVAAARRRALRRARIAQARRRVVALKRSIRLLSR